ncbi:MAG: hypothetical protein B7Z61_13520 [Acidobacteria bacterium 37-71-11]|nr:MAG: hypothetical protein B7Z61_13520 [Acidobacteria bacterium 37-71-11]
MPAYERDPYMKTLTTEIVETGMEGGRPFAVLADTVLYPEGGGQPADRGWLGEVEVIDVQRREGTVRHFLACPVEPGPVTVHVDWARRFDHMQQHTGQHLLTAVAADRFGWPTTAFHLGEKLCDVELGVAALASTDLEALEAAVAEKTRAALAVFTRRVTQAEFAALDVRTRGLPAGHAGDVRLVEIAGTPAPVCAPASGRTRPATPACAPPSAPPTTRSSRSPKPSSSSSRRARSAPAASRRSLPARSRRRSRRARTAF